MNLIIGGTHGLGAEIARVLRSDNQETFVVGRSYDEGKDGQGRALDLSDEVAVKAFVAEVEQMEITGFWWVAGFGYNKDFADQENPEAMAKVNFGNVLPIAQAAWKQLLKQGGNFVVVSSTTGVKARNNEAVYAGTKFAQVGFTRSLGLESERLESKVKVALFMPGGMQTPFWEGNEPDNLSEYLDPAKVAAKIVGSVNAQAETFYEETIERGSL